MDKKDINPTSITAIPVHGKHAQLEISLAIDNISYHAERYERVKKTYGAYASWAVWAPQIDKPKSGTNDLSVFDISHNDTILQQIHTKFILVGLNVSRDPGALPFSNFHSGNRRSQDYKLRRAIEKTPLWGSYLTDLIKGLEEKSSYEVMKRIKQDPSLLQRNLDIFREEMNTIGAEGPTLVAL